VKKSWTLSRGHPRDKLAALFWGARGGEQARRVSATPSWPCPGHSLRWQAVNAPARCQGPEEAAAPYTADSTSYLRVSRLGVAGRRLAATRGPLVAAEPESVDRTNRGCRRERLSVLRDEGSSRGPRRTFRASLSPWSIASSTAGGRKQSQCQNRNRVKSESCAMLPSNSRSASHAHVLQYFA